MDFGGLKKENEMKTRCVYLVFVIFLIVSLAACAAPRTPTVPTYTPYPYDGRLVIDNLTSKALEGNLMGNSTNREFLVYLPPDYATSGKRYPVVYVLHGGGEGDGGPVNDVKNAARKLLKNGDAKEMIFVFPDATNNFIGSMYMSSITNGDFETYITKELVEKVDSTYRTIPNRDSRGITGCSMGGMGSMHLALKYPDIYGVAVPMNGSISMYEPYIELEWKEELSGFNKNGYSDWSKLADSGIWWMASLAMIASPNPNKPPFYFDMPYKEENGKTIIDPDVYEKVKKLEVTNDINAYLAQPTRLNNLFIYTSDENGEKPLPKIISNFDKYLTTKGVPHDFTMFSGGHCTYDLSPVIKYLSDHLFF
jgi:S-formylglutathione hydrolase FrmB